jgi:hypothetical protein
MKLFRYGNTKIRSAMIFIRKHLNSWFYDYTDKGDLLMRILASISISLIPSYFAMFLYFVPYDGVHSVITYALICLGVPIIGGLFTWICLVTTLTLLTLPYTIISSIVKDYKEFK